MTAKPEKFKLVYHDPKLDIYRNFDEWNEMVYETREEAEKARDLFKAKNPNVKEMETLEVIPFLFSVEIRRILKDKLGHDKVFVGGGVISVIIDEFEHEFSASIEKTGRRVRNLETRKYIDEPDLDNLDKVAENILLLTK